MRKICPECQGAFEKQFLCPNCGVQLQDVADLSPRSSTRGLAEQAHAPEMATRFLAGLALAQGLYYGLILLGAGVRLAMGQTPEWPAPIAKFGEMGLLAGSVLAGGLVAGAGNIRALAAGIALGLIHAIAVITPKFLFGHQPNELFLIESGMVIPILGGIGARIGRSVFPSLADIPDATIMTVKESRNAKQKKEPSPPIAWARILGGAALSIGCTVWAGPIRDFVIGTSGGSFVVDSRLQSKFVTWVISALAMMVGGVFAGASTRSGSKHGFLVGFLACIGIFIIHSQVVNESLPAEKFFAAIFGLPETDALTPPRLGLFLLTNALLLGVFGGWIGASLLPKVTGGPSRLDRGAI